MPAATLFRLSGWAAVLSGLAIIIDTLVIELFLPEAALTDSVGYLGVVLGVFALLGVYLWQRAALSAFGDIGFIVNFLGLVLLTGVMLFKNYVQPFLSPEALQALFAGPTRLVFLASALTFLTGVVLFGIATLRAGMIPRLATLLYMVGFALFSLEPFLPDLVVRVAQTLGGASIVWFGAVLMGVAPRGAGRVAPQAGAALTRP